jgi:hypothetical protein
MRALLAVLMGVVWALAAVAWPDLPPRIPIHFDLAGYADGWADTSVWAWFALPALGTLLGVVFGFLLPRWMLGMARTKSRWLNVPHKAAFLSLPVESRERVVRVPLGWLHAIACCVQGLLGWLVLGSARVADGRWDVLPSWPGFTMLAVLLGCALGLAIATSRAVQREVVSCGQ